jgi:hypothetical protein
MSKGRRSTTAPPRKRAARRGVKRTLLLSAMLAFGVAALAASGAIFPAGIPGARAARAEQEQVSISPAALEQITALMEEKESRTAEQAKIDSQLLYAAKMESDQPIAPGVQALQTNVTPTESGGVVVDITAQVDDSLIRALEGVGAKVISSYPDYHSVRAEVSFDQLGSIAALSAVRFIRPKAEAMVEQAQAAPAASGQFLPPDFAERAAVVRERLAMALSAANNDDPPAQTNTGKVTSEGDTTHKAARARGTFNVNGTGVKIGVISDGALSIASAQQSGDLPPDVVILPGQQGGCTPQTVCDEGTAMLEIVYDLAPGAKLFFATANGGPAAFADNIRKLRQAGCHIIVDDISYPTVETPFHDGQPPAAVTQGAIVTQAVNEVTADGCLYFSSAGNSGNKNDGTSGVWEGDFADAGPITITVNSVPTAYNKLDFDTSAAVADNDLITGTPSPQQSGTLFWSDPLGASTNDYDVFILNNAGNAVVAAGTNIQNGTTDPVETWSAASNVANNRVLVAKKTTAAARFLHVNTNRGRLSFSTAGQTHGHSSAANAYSTAATPAVGPFPSPFSSSNVVETFSSDGPRRIFYDANNLPITPGNVSSTGGLVRQKPDITAADGVSVTGAGNFSSPFFGTSAAAPHAAAIAGLLKSFNLSATPAQIRTALTSSAIDIETPGVDRDAGAGIVMAFEGLLAMGATGSANLEVTGVAATELGGNGNTFIEPGERGNLNVTLLNSGLAAATNITATLTTTTPGVTVKTPGTSAYPNIPVNGTGTNTTPFEFFVDPSVSCTQAIDFTLTVSYTGGTSPRTFNFKVQIGRSVSISTTLDGTPPPASAEYTAVTGLQAGRLNRFSPPSDCSFNKTNPGLLAPTGARQYDAYSFQNTSPSALCVTVSLSATNSNLYSATYLGSFNPANPAQNFLGDAGSSFTFTQYSVLVPAGATYVVVVHEVNPGGGVGTNYTLQVGRPCSAAPSFTPGTLQFSTPTYSTGEGDGTGTVTVTRTGGSSGATTVSYTVSNGTATAGADYTGAGSGELTFADGETSKNIVIPILEDLLDEADETVNFSLDSVTSGFATLGSPRTALLRINDNDAAPSLSINDVTVNEGNSGTTNASFTVTLSPASGQAVTVNATTADGTAVAPSDYQAVNTTLTFAPGETSKTLSVPVVGDTVGEFDENFFVNLSGAVNATVSDAQGVGTIHDEEAAATVQFGDPSHAIVEDATFINVAVTRSGDTSGAASVRYTTVNGTASDRSDYNAVAGTLTFPAGETGAVITVLINEDSLVEGTEAFTLSLSSPQGTDVGLGAQSSTTVTITDDPSEPSANTIDDTSLFVWQHYHDFLNREPDGDGLAFWTNGIDSCGADAGCREVKRIDTSAAFFLSIEFQRTGYFVYRSYTAAFGPGRVGSTVPLTLQEFLPDTQQIGRGVVIGQPGADALLESNKQAYVLEFVQRPAFVAQYPGTMTPAQFVDALNANTGNSLTPAQRDALVAQLSANNTTQGRADVFRQVVENDAFQTREFNRAFVLMQYFGYLRRNPNDAPDANFDGYNFWLAKLNSFNGDFRKAEMVKAFINSAEYRKRFGQN